MAAESDGLVELPGLSWLADLGSRGGHVGNAERDFHRRARRELKINIDLYEVLAPIRTADNKIVNNKFGVLLPHEIFAELANHHGHEFTARMKGESGLLSKYWDCHKQETWFLEHPLRHDILREPDKHIPIRLWGDDSGINKRQTRSIRVLTWSSATVKATSLSSKIAVYYIQTQKMTRDTEPTLLKAVAWSLNALLTGYHPLTDHLGKPLTGDRASKAGTQRSMTCAL